MENPANTALAVAEVNVAVASATSTRYPIPHPFEHQGNFYQGQVELVEQYGDPVAVRQGADMVATGEYHYDIYEVLMLDGRVVQALKSVGSGIVNPSTRH